MCPDPNPSPQPEPEPEPSQPESAEDDRRCESELLPHAEADTREALLPTFIDYCATLGVPKEASADEVSLIHRFRVGMLKLLGNDRSDQPVILTNHIAVRAVEEWGSRRSVVVAAEFVNKETGHSRIPLEIVVDDEEKLSNPSFWITRNGEEFSAPVALAARLRPDDGLADVDAIFSGPGLREAVVHARGVAVQIARRMRENGPDSVCELASGSLIFAMLCNKLQQSHEEADRDVPRVEGPLARNYRARDELSTAPILGVRKFAFGVAPHEHEVGVVALDVRSAGRDDVGSSPGGLIVGLPLVEKTYRLRQVIDGGVLPQPVIKSVWIAPYRRAM